MMTKIGKRAQSFINSKPENEKWFHIAVLCLAILISDLIIFFDFISGKYVYSFRGWGYDTYHQFVPELELLYQNIVEKRTGLMSFQDGLGIDLMSIQRWITDPFTLLILIIAILIGNMNLISELMVLLPIAVSICGGIVCCLYLKRYINTSRAIILASYMYGLCGYLVSTGTHYWFASFLVYFPLLLIAVDRIIFDRKFGMFIVMVFAVAVHGAYGAFPMFISAGVYLIYKSLGLDITVKERICLWGQSILTGCIGLFISAIIFIPNLYEMVVVSGRIDNTSLVDKIIESLRLLNIDELATAVSRIFSNNLFGNVDDWQGIQAWFCAFPYFFSILFIFLAVQYIRFYHVDCQNKKQKIYTIIGLAIVGIALITNFVPELFNLFNYNQWRMIFVLLPFFAYASAKALDRMILKGCFSNSVNICCGIVCLLVLYAAYKLGYVRIEKVYYQCIFFVCIFCVLLLLFNMERVVKSRAFSVFIYVGIFFMTAVNLIVDHRFSIVGGASPVAWEQSGEYYEDKFIEETLEKIHEEEGDAFIRVDRTYLSTSSDTCWSYVIPCRSVTMYNSILNHCTKEYMTYMVKFSKEVRNDIIIIYSAYDYDTYFDAARATMLGLKYVITNQERSLDDWELVYQKDGLYTYKNMTFSTGGVLYDSYLLEDKYEQLSTIDKACIEAQSVVLNDSIGQLEVFNEDIIQYRGKNLDLTKQIILENAGFISESDCAQINANENAKIIIPIDRELLKGTKERNLINFYVTSSEGGNITVRLLIGNGEYGEGEETYPFALGETKEISRLLPDDCCGIEINVKNHTVIDIDNIQLVGIPITYSNEVTLMNENMGNTVHGTIYANKPSVLYSSIPYLKGWRAYVDGEEVKVFKANYGFVAIEVQQGGHEVVFEYSNPVVKASAIFSIIGVLSLGIYIGFIKKKCKSRAAKKTKKVTFRRIENNGTS